MYKHRHIRSQCMGNHTCGCVRSPLCVQAQAHSKSMHGESHMGLCEKSEVTCVCRHSHIRSECMGNHTCGCVRNPTSLVCTGTSTFEVNAWGVTSHLCVQQSHLCGYAAKLRGCPTDAGRAPQGAWQGQRKEAWDMDTTERIGWSKGMSMHASS